MDYKIQRENMNDLTQNDIDLFNAIAIHSPSDNSDVFEEYIKKEANVNVQNGYGYTPLMLCVLWNYTKPLRMLIKYKADTELRNDDNKTALMIAVNKRRIESIKILISANANIEAKDSDGNTALMLACIEDHDIPSIVDDILIEHGATVVDILIQNGANVNARNKRGETALILATMLGAFFKPEEYANVKKDIVNSLIKAGAQINVTDFGRSTPLTIARHRGDDKILRILQDELNKIKSQ